MDFQFIRDRISVLRTKKNVSEYRMSTDLGHSKSYMQSISSGRSMPSLGEFLYICEYLGVTPREFFDEDMKEIIEKSAYLDDAGKHTLHTVLLMEYARCTKSKVELDYSKKAE